ncbi:MAG: DUF1566 domain-containing protein [Parabacteroides gordonii]|uniref:Lcl domain-containing protein n=1 Tax=Parabacteroides gordonii TaxID=574930 RepID=UPI003A899329
MKKDNIILLLCLWFCSVLWNNVSAQKVYNGGGYAVVDLSDLSSLGVVTTEKGRIKVGTPSNKKLLSSDNLLKGTWNTKMYYKFEVSNDDNYLNWAGAVSYCQNKGGDWRLPTDSEWKMILILSPQLVALGSCFSKFQPAVYWSLTEHSAEGSYGCMTQSMVMGENSKESPMYFRCIREM